MSGGDEDDKARDDPADWIVAYDKGLRIDLAQAAFQPTWHLPDSDDLTPGQIDRYRSDFRFPMPRERWVSDGHSHILLVAFDNAVCSYFNDRLARSMILADWGLKNASREEELPLLEDAIMRQAACWEYLVQEMNHFLGFTETVFPTRKALDRFLGIAAYDVDFVEHESGLLEQVHHYRGRRSATATFRDRRVSLSYSEVGSRADRFFDQVRDTLAPHSWLDQVKRLLRDAPVRRVREMRNDIAHSHPLGARFHPDAGEPFESPTLRIAMGEQSRVDPRAIFTTLRQAHQRLEKAIAIYRQALATSDRPNRKANAGEEFKAWRLRCGHCRQTTIAPRIGDAERLLELGGLYCQNCGLLHRDMEVVDELDVSDVVFGTLLRGLAEQMSTAGVVED